MRENINCASSIEVFMDKINSVGGAVKTGRTIRIRFAAQNHVASGVILAVDNAKGVLIQGNYEFPKPLKNEDIILFVPWTSLEAMEIEGVEYGEGGIPIA